MGSRNEGDVFRRRDRTMGGASSELMHNAACWPFGILGRGVGTYYGSWKWLLGSYH